MYTKSIHMLRRALALMLAVALLGALGALGEEEPLATDDAPELLLPEADELSLDEAQAFTDELELAGDLELPDDLALDLEGDLDLDLVGEAPESAADNDSKPAPEYKPSKHTLKLLKNRSCTIGIKDSLVILVAEGKISSWKNSNKKVVKIARSAKNKSKLNVTPRAVGTTKITVAVEGGKSYTVDLTVNDPASLKKLSFTQQAMTLYTGMDIDLNQHYTVQPATAWAKVSFSTSDSSVASLSKNNILTGLKAGKVVVTANAGSGIKATMNVEVKANCTAALHATPTAADAKKLGQKWTLWPGSVEMLGDGRIACQLWVLNGAAGRMTGLKKLDLAITREDKHGGALIARASFDTIGCACEKGAWQAVTVTFPIKSVYCSALNFTGLTAKDLSFQLYGTPVAGYADSRDAAAYQADGIPVDKKDAGAKPARYRALLVSESDFYWPYAKDPAKIREQSISNRVDVIAFKNMLEHVQTPDGSKYSVTTQNNTTKKQLKDLIKKTFANATENDVSLFFIATHGDSGDKVPDSKSGALVMSSMNRKAVEIITLEELRDCLLKVPGKVIVILHSCGSGAAVYQKGKSGKNSLAKAAKAFDANAVDVFRSADPGVNDGEYAANTGEFRVANKFYVLTSANYHEECFGVTAYSYFPSWLIKGVGKSGDMPADKKYAGNNNGMVDLHELYRYISQEGDRYKIKYKGATYYQHVQVYPSNVRFPLFK